MVLNIEKKWLMIAYSHSEEVLAVDAEGTVEYGEIKHLQSGWNKIPVLNEEKYPAKADMIALQAEPMDDLLETSLSNFGEDAVIRDVFNYISTAMIQVKASDYASTERETELHDRLKAVNKEISKERIAQIRADALAAKELKM